MNNWTNKDWKWLVGCLISIIVLTISAWMYKLPDAMNYFSFMASIVSIILALVAIYIALSQNNNSEILNARTADILARVEEKIMNVNEKVNKIDPKEIALITETRVNGALNQFSEKLYSKLEELGIDKDKIKEIKKDIESSSNVIAPPTSDNCEKSENQALKLNSIIKEEVIKVLNIIKNKSFSDSISIINSTLLTNQAREILYASLIKGPFKKERDENNGIYDTLAGIYLFNNPPLFNECIN
jgi:hypothetical protein